MVFAWYMIIRYIFSTTGVARLVKSRRPRQMACPPRLEGCLAMAPSSRLMSQGLRLGIHLTPPILSSDESRPTARLGGREDTPFQSPQLR